MARLLGPAGYGALSALLPIHRGVLQGMKRFRALGENMIWEVLAKLVVGVGVGVIWIGAREYAAVAGVSLGFCIAFALSRLPLRDVYRTLPSRAAAPDLYQ